MATSDNLKDAFAGESQANRKYSIYADKAEKEGFKGIAKYFRAASMAEAVHAESELKAAKQVKSTAENLQDAVDGENYEFKTMYPEFIEKAREEDNKAALIAFKHAMTVEQIHYSLYLQALEKAKTGEDIEVKDIFVCGVCGNTVLDEKPDKCPICGAPSTKFDEVK
jgi:rubrerythrin